MTTENDCQERMNEIVRLKDELHRARKRIAHLECCLTDEEYRVDEPCTNDDCEKICEARNH